MVQKRDRFFAGFGAALFLISASALTVVAIISSASENKNATVDQSQTATCEASATIASSSLAVPEVFKPEGDVAKLEMTELEAADGAAIKAGDCIQVKYHGSLAKDGTVFDGNFDKPTAFQFPLGGGQVIQGWDQGLVGAKVGSTVRLLIPSDLAYGDQGNSSIPANSDLVFVVKVLKVTE